MRDNSKAMVELVRAYERDGGSFGLVRLTIEGETRPIEVPLAPAARLGFLRALDVRPFDAMPGTSHRYFFTRSVRRLEGGEEAEVGIRVEVGPDTKSFMVKVPLAFASKLVWLAEVKAWSELAGLSVGVRA